MIEMRFHGKKSYALFCLLTLISLSVNLSYNLSTANLRQRKEDERFVSDLVTSDSTSSFDWGPPDGITLSRTIEKLPDLSKLYIVLSNDKASSPCKSSDKFGSNECLLKWGDNFHADIKVTEGITIDETYEIQGAFKLKKVVDWSFSCPACGEPCTIKIPIVDKSMTLAPQECPLVPEEGVSAAISKSFTMKLPKSSPLGGAKLPVEGNLFLKRKSDGVIVASIDFSIMIK